MQRLSSLDFDTLVVTMRWIRNPKDMISFMSTSSDFYNAGLPILLGLHHQIDNRNLRQFYGFLVSKGSASFAALRSLKLSFEWRLSVPALEQDGINMLDDILSQTRDLQHLEVWGEALRKNPSLHRRLASLSSLTSLDLSHSYGPRTEEQYIITHLRAPLSKLGLTGDPEDEIDIVTLPANFRYTLEELTVRNTTFVDDAGGSCYPKLVHLNLAGIHRLRLSLLVPAFPNLQTLELIFPSDVLDEDDDETHVDNVRFQRDHPLQRWHLLRLKGDATCLYSLGLQTQVPSVVITRFCWVVPSAQLAETLSLLRPVDLCFEGQVEEAVEWTWLSDTITTDWNDLKQLHLRIEYNRSGVPLSTYDERLEKLFHELSLVSRSIPYLSCINLTLAYCFMLRVRDISLDFLDGLRMEVLAARALRAIPTLKAAKFVITTTSTRTSYWISDLDGDGLMPILSQDETAASQIFNEYIAPFIQAHD